MKKEFEKIVFAVVTIYAVFGLFYAMNLVPGAGDESFFIDDLNLIKNKGWIEAIKKNISIPYMILVYPFTFLMKNYMAVRLVNLLLGLSLYVYFFKRNKPSFVFFTYLTFYIGTSKVFFIGTNDALFVAGLVVFFNETFKRVKGEKWMISAAFVGLIVSFFTRKMILVYLPVIIYGVYTIYHHKGYSKKLLKAPLIVFVFFMFCNMPSLNTNGRLSYDLKLSPQKYEASYAQLQYLAQLLVNDGTLKDKTHPSFKTTQEYLDTHGENSLPKSIMEGILFDPALTIKEFFKDFFDITLYGFRQLALMMFVPFFFLFLGIKRKSFFSAQVFVPILLFVSMCVFSLIIISFVELRWFAWVFIMCTVFYYFLERQKALPLNVIRLNNVFLVLLSCYGIYKILPKIMA